MIECLSVSMCQDILDQYNQDIDDNYSIGIVQMYVPDFTGDEALEIVNMLYNHLIRHLANVKYEDYDIVTDARTLIIKAKR